MATWAGGRRQGRRQVDIQPLVDEGQVLGGQHDFLGVLDQPVVLGVEDVVDGGQADVFVGAAVAGDEMGIQQFVVVDRRIVAGVEQADFDVAVGDAVRDRVMGDVREEGGVDADTPVETPTGAAEVPEMTMSSAVFGMPSAPTPVMICAKPAALGMKLPYASVRSSGTAPTSWSVRRMPSILACSLTSPQVAMPPGCGAAALDQLAGGVRDAVGVERILAQEHLVGGVRRIGLVLVDERSRGVDRPDIVSRAHDAVSAGRNGGAGQHHEVGRAALHIQRIVRLQWDKHRAAAALVDEIETVIEELAEQREPRVERGREPDVRRDVGDLDVVAVHREAERLEGRIAHCAGGFQIGEREGVRRRRGGQGVERGLFGGAGRGEQGRRR